jgi:internalin A
MSELAKWPNLHSLDLGQTLVTNAGLDELANSTSLIELRLHYSKVDDEGIKKLSRLKGLQCLNLRSTAVTDSSPQPHCNYCGGRGKTHSLTHRPTASE